MNPIFIVMGVSGCGKSTIGKLLADRLKLPFYDADDFHPDSNKDKMAKGIPLTDDDRLPWLNAIWNQMKIWTKADGAVLACSALKETYRALLSKELKVQWIYLDGNYDLIRNRLNERKNHFFNPELLLSQFDILEVPDYALKMDISNSPESIINSIISETKGYA